MKRLLQIGKGKNSPLFLRKKQLATFAAILCMMPAMAQMQTIVNVVEQTAQIERTSTLYVGEVLLDGQQSFYYLYSEDMTNSSTVLAAVRDCLTGFKDGIYRTLISNEAYIGEGTGITACSNSAYESVMNSDWTSAGYAGLACLPNTTAISSSSDNLFETDDDFAEHCSLFLSSNGIELVDNEGEPLAVSGVLGVLSSSSTDIVTYTVIEGVLYKLVDRHMLYNCESVTVIYTSVELVSPLTFEAVEDGTITVNLDEGWTPENIQYQLNGGDWTEVTWGEAIDLAANDVISFRGDNGTCYATDEETYWAGFHFEPSNDCYVYGNMMSLIDKDDFATNTTLTEPFTFFHLFQRSDYEPNTAILNHPTYDIVLPATTLAPYCYDGLFADAPYITRATELPATTLADWCYSEMFSGTAITTAPALPATTLANACYSDMFMNCTSLTTAPDLPAAILVEGCYSSMFAGCTSLNYVKCLATDISADYCTSGWMWGVAETGTFVKAVGMNDWTTGEDGIPEGWTVLEDTPYIIPLTFEAVEAGTINIDNPNTLTIEYNKNNSGWTSANTDPISITVAAGDVVQFRGDNACYWATGDSGETVTRFTATNPVYVYGNVMSLIDKDDFPTNTTLTEEFALAYLFAAPSSDIFQFYANNSTILNHPNKDLMLPATTLSETCYGYMFAGCEGLTRAPELPATTLAMGCYHQMFADCSGLTEAPSLPATTLTDMCYSSMFYNCTSLTSAPDLLATSLVEGCYMGMFDGCSNLNYVRSLATSVYETDCTTDWLNGVAVEGTFIKAYGMWDWSTGANGIPVGWTVEEDLTTAPLTIEAVEDGTVVTITNTNSLYLRVSINYGGSTSSFNTNQTTYTQTLPAGTALSIKLHGMTGTNTSSSNFTVTASKDVYVYGNPLSLVFSSFSNKTDLTGCAYGVLEDLFCLGYEGSTLNPHIKNHPTKDIVLPATTLSDGCYMAMFSGCTGLTRAPELPATILSEDCYHRMFEYSGLIQAPVLPADTLIGQCYGGMFDHCTNLNYVRCMATNLGENNGELACGDWLKDVAATGTFVKAPGMESWTIGPQEPGGLIYGIPEGWITCDKVFQTAGDWNVAANWNTGTVPAAGSDVVIAANAIVPDEYVADAGSVFVEQGNTLTIADGGQLIHSNNVNATLQKTINAYSDQQGVNDGWYTIASPVVGDYSTEGLTVGTYDLYLYDEPTHYWWNAKGDSQNNQSFTTLGNGQGYLYANSANQTLAFAGETQATNATVTVPLSYTATAGNLQGYNLVGNPFTRNLTAGDVKLGDANLTSYYYVSNGSELSVTTIAERPIKPGEGFFVQASAATNLVFNPATAKGGTCTKPAFIRIEVGNGHFVDYAYVQIGQGNTLRKMALNDNATKVCVMNDGMDYAAATIEAAEGEMPVNFKAAEKGTYTIRVRTDNLNLAYLHLIDNLTGNDVDLLAMPSYTFEAKTSDYESRFRLVFSNSGEAAGDNATFAFINNGEIVITGDVEGATLQVIDVMGHAIICRDAINRVSTTGMVPGVYVLRLIQGDDVRMQKMVIR